MLLKFTMQGKFLQQIGRREQSGGNKDTKNLKEPADVVVYRKTNEAFVADGYGNRRVIVLDANTGAFKRMWGAFGNVPVDGPQAPPPGTAATAAARRSIRSRVRRSFRVPCTPSRCRTTGWCMSPTGATGASRCSLLPASTSNSCSSIRGAYQGQSHCRRIPQQQFLYVGDSGNSRILVVNRKSLEIVGEFVKKGSLSPHHMATDSKGNIYTAETGRGTQRLLFKGTSPAATQ